MLSSSIRRLPRVALRTGRRGIATASRNDALSGSAHMNMPNLTSSGPIPRRFMLMPSLNGYQVTSPEMARKIVLTSHQDQKIRSRVVLDGGIESVEDAAGLSVSCDAPDVQAMRWALHDTLALCGVVADASPNSELAASLDNLDLNKGVSFRFGPAIDDVDNRRVSVSQEEQELQQLLDGSLTVEGENLYDSNGFLLDSVVRKRKTKMNKHKLKKRRKLERFRSRRNTK